MQETDLNILKYKLVLRPIMLSIIGFFVFYSLFHWVCLTYFYNFEFAEEYLNSKLYLILIVLLNLIVILPRFNLILIKKLKTPEFNLPKFLNFFNEKHNNNEIKHPKSTYLNFLNILMLNICIFLTMLSIQDDINSYFSKLNKLNNLSEIKSKPATKYYMPQNFFIDLNCKVSFQYLDTITKKTGPKWARKTETSIYNVTQELYPVYNFSKDTTNKELIIDWVYEADVKENNIRTQNSLIRSLSKPIYYTPNDTFLVGKPSLMQDLPIMKYHKVIKTDKYFIRLAKSSRQFEKLNERIKFDTLIDHKNLLLEYRNNKFENRTNSVFYLTFIISLAWLIGLYFYLNKSELDSEKIERLQNGESIYSICLPDIIAKYLENKSI